MLLRKLILSFPVFMAFATLPAFAQSPAVTLPGDQSGMNYPGQAYHYHVKTAWTDSRVIAWGNGITKSAIGFIFKETPGAWYFPYNYALPQEVAQANGAYATLLSAMATGEEITIHVFANNGGHYYFDLVQIGQAY